jgi:hypothetical protein
MMKPRRHQDFSTRGCSKDLWTGDRKNSGTEFNSGRAAPADESGKTITVSNPHEVKNQLAVGSKRAIRSAPIATQTHDYATRLQLRPKRVARPHHQQAQPPRRATQAGHDFKP